MQGVHTLPLLVSIYQVAIRKPLRGQAAFPARARLGQQCCHLTFVWKDLPLTVLYMIDFFSRTGRLSKIVSISHSMLKHVSNFVCLLTRHFYLFHACLVVLYRVCDRNVCFDGNLLVELFIYYT